MLNKNDDFNNELELILEDKTFDEDVKSLLLSIFYRIEQSYKDYALVKRNVVTKEEFFKKLISDIKNNCDSIKLISPNSDDVKILGKHTFLIDYDKKKIYCYNMERKLLYCISKISKKDFIIKDKYPIIYKTISNLINVGNNINLLEPYRDFNGYSWAVIPDEIESVDHNLIYQNLIFLVGYEMMDKWVECADSNIDYYDLFIKKLEELYGKEYSKLILNGLSNLSFLLNCKFDKEFKKEMVEFKKEVEDKVDVIEDKIAFVELLTKKKKELIKKIKKIDKLVNDKHDLQKEYDKLNAKLPLEKKIFSLRILISILEKDRNKMLEQIDKYNELMKPENFINYRDEIKYKNKFLKLITLKDMDGKIFREKISFEKIIIKCFRDRLNKVTDKQEMINLIYDFRYYCMLMFDHNKKVYEVLELSDYIKNLIIDILQKSHELKVIQRFSKNNEVDYILLRGIFYSRSIKLEKISVKLVRTKDKEKLFVETYDEEMLEDKVQFESIENLSNKDFEIRYNKKVKVFY